VLDPMSFCQKGMSVIGLQPHVHVDINDQEPLNFVESNER